ncbi:DUF5666 domain-containing protein [Merismopedia glauca]|uniref:DUF5666 domain-containing protein n=1 Tax=Merismopedia glauca TaxID=292586 RepID=UPI001C6260A1|nr:DUF5666 domain-containing protein [Merismopedia glauca]
MKKLSGLNLVLATSVALALPFAVNSAFAKGGGNLPRIKGIVSSRPAGNIGTWVVGGQRFTANRATQFDTVEGPLRVGSCAKVRYVVSGSIKVAQEIDSEPITDCR